MEQDNLFSKRYLEFKDKHATVNLDMMSLEDLNHYMQEASEIEKEYNNVELVVKADANSIYGSSASKYYSLYCPRLAEDITMTGKHFTVLIDKALNNYFKTWNNEDNLRKIQTFYPQVKSLKNFEQYIPDSINDLCVYGDTDSRYVRIDLLYDLLVLEDGKLLLLPEDDNELADFVVFLNEQYFAPIIKQTIEKDCKYRNARIGYMKMGHEVTARRCSFIKKKKYIMNSIWADDKMLSKPKLKFRGIELRRGSMSESAKKILEFLVIKYLQNNCTVDEMRKECLRIFKYIKTKNDKNLIYQISSVSGLSAITQDKNGVYVSDKKHIQIQLACSWLNFIRENNLQDRYQPPFEGQKMQFYYCQDDSGYKVIGVPDDVDITSIQNLPEPDWKKMIITSIIKPFCRYILNKEDVDDKDVEYFLMNVQQINF